MKKLGMFLLTLSLLVSTMFTGVVHASETTKETPKEFTVQSEEFSILDDKTQVVEVDTENGKWTFTIEDDMPDVNTKLSTNLNPNTNSNITPNGYVYWPYGSFNKKVTANFEGDEGAGSILGHMSARFKGSINPYIATITEVSEGEFNASVINPTGEKYYEVLKGSATSSEYAATARYREKYNILGFGQHDMCLYLYVNTQGQATIFTAGIW